MKMRRSDPRILILGALLALSAAGLVVLGISAADAVEARAMLQARNLLDGAAVGLADGLEEILADGDAAADGWTPDGPDHPLLADVFVVDERGRLLQPEVSHFPALPPPDPEEAESARRTLREAASLDPETAAELLQTAAFEEVRHPDLVATLVMAMADRAADEGNVDRATYLYGSIAEDLPGARDFGGEPLAVTAHLRRLGLLRSAGDRRKEAAAFAMRLADRAWDLPRVEREMTLTRLAEEFPDGRLPEAVERRREFVDAFRARVRFAPGDGSWQHEALARDDGVHVFGWRELVLEGRTCSFGYRIAPSTFRSRAEEASREIAGRFGTRVEIGLSPAISAGALPDRDPLARRVDLPPGFGGLEAAVAVRGPGGLGGLRALHVAMTIVLAAALATGIFLSLRAVRRELATARIRQNLLDNTSHELRTPLTTIRMHAEMLAEEDLPGETRDAYAGLVLAESERLSRLVDDVLDLSKLSRGETAVATEPEDPASLVRAAVEAWPGGEISVSVPPDLPPVAADRDAAVRVLLNLLDNARKYAGGPVAIEGRARGDAVELVVIDHGEGIPEAEQAQLFTRFYRSPRDARRAKGVGLGLVLAREIARAQGGDVRLLSSSGEGSRFALVLAKAEGVSG